MSLLTRATKSLISRSGALAIPRHCSSRAAVILRYHSISRHVDYCPPTIAVDPTLFDRQMAYLAAHYRVVPLDDLMDILKGDGKMPARAVAITFDDGYADNVEVACPILVRHGLTATFHVVSGAVVGGRAFWVGWLYRAVCHADQGRLDQLMREMGSVPEAGGHRRSVFDSLAGAVNRLAGEARWTCLERLGHVLGAPPLSRRSDFMMRPEQASAALRMGMSIGGHTVSHPILASLPSGEALAEMRDGRLELEAALGVPVRHLAYPNGPGVPVNFTAQTAALAEVAGFRSAGTSLRGAAFPGADPYSLVRQGINQSLGFHGFAVKLEEHKVGRLLARRAKAAS